MTDPVPVRPPLTVVGNVVDGNVPEFSNEDGSVILVDSGHQAGGGGAAGASSRYLYLTGSDQFTGTLNGAGDTNIEQVYLANTGFGAVDFSGATALTSLVIFSSG